MKYWVKWFHQKQTTDTTYHEICGSDGVGYLDGRLSIRSMIAECIERASNRKINKPGAFQIHCSGKFSLENPVTKVIPV